MMCVCFAAAYLHGIHKIHPVWMMVIIDVIGHILYIQFPAHSQNMNLQITIYRFCYDINEYLCSV